MTVRLCKNRRCRRTLYGAQIRARHCSDRCACITEQASRAASYAKQKAKWQQAAAERRAA